MRSASGLQLAVGDLVAGLGADAEQVAASLGRHGVRGRPRDERGCALAAYLNAVVSADRRVRRVEVTKDCVRIRLWGWWRRVVVPLPLGVRSFVERFDSGYFPALTDAHGAPAPNGRVPTGAG